jgi:hypothetical protein
MEIKTEVGKILHELDYVDSQVERFDKLAMHLYTIPINERYELLSALMWYCGAMQEDGTVKNDYRHRIEYYDKLLAKINNK